MRKHLESLLELDVGILGESWDRFNFQRALPGKWQCSQLALNQSSEPVGFAVASVKQHRVHVHRLAVKHSHRGIGLGTRLMKAVSRAALEKGIETITLKVLPDNVPAVRFYRALGFHRTGMDRGNLTMSCTAQILLDPTGSK